ncbi:hypothetical protein C8Q77DRAFT_1182018 [Trametes polyzona]|nr:hypothetical protein C8Q77DRAFT_1182018 [Trametes polyzona]
MGQVLGTGPYHNWPYHQPGPIPLHPQRHIRPGGLVRPQERLREVLPREPNRPQARLLHDGPRPPRARPRLHEPRHRSRESAQVHRRHPHRRRRHRRPHLQSRSLVGVYRKHAFGHARHAQDQRCHRCPCRRRSTPRPRLHARLRFARRNRARLAPIAPLAPARPQPPPRDRPVLCVQQDWPHRTRLPEAARRREPYDSIRLRARDRRPNRHNLVDADYHIGKLRDASSRERVLRRSGRGTRCIGAGRPAHRERGLLRRTSERWAFENSGVHGIIPN